MNLAYYVVVFDRGTDAWLELAGLGEGYRKGGGSVFAVEAHTIYRQEVGLGADLLVRTCLVAASGKRIHLMHEMACGAETVALQEVLFLHADLQTRRSTPLPNDADARVQALAPPPHWRRPAWLGRHVGQAR